MEPLYSEQRSFGREISFHISKLEDHDENLYVKTLALGVIQIEVQTRRQGIITVSRAQGSVGAFFSSGESQPNGSTIS